MTPTTRETADRETLVMQSIIDAHGQWEIENRNRKQGDGQLWQDGHVRLLAQAAIIAADHIGEANEKVTADHAELAAWFRTQGERHRPSAAKFTAAAEALLHEAASALRDLTEWRDIATAPKDGDAILISRPTHFMDEEGWHVVRWEADSWICHDGKFDTPLRGPDPTHWLPLPSAPNQAKEAGE